MSHSKKPPKKTTEKHWKLVRFHEGLEVYDEGGDDGSGGFGSLGGELPLTQEEQAILERHSTRQENHAKETKALIIERTFQLSQGQTNFGNADMQQQFHNGKAAHPLLADKAQFSGAEELSPFADTDNNQERQLQLRQVPEQAPAPAPSIFQTPRNTMGG